MPPLIYLDFSAPLRYDWLSRRIFFLFQLYFSKRISHDRQKNQVAFNWVANDPSGLVPSLLPTGSMWPTKALTWSACTMQFRECLLKRHHQKKLPSCAGRV